MSESERRIDPDLEVQYDNRGAVPEHVDIMAQWAVRSEETRAGGRCRLDLAYGPREREKLDLFLAEHENAPVHVYIHGGYWQRGDRRLYSFVADGLRAAGVNVAVVGYDLCPEVAIDDIVDEVRRACAWLWRNAGELGVDRDRMQVGGHSAGGHLTAMVLATAWPELDPALPPDLVKSGLAISGLFDLEPLRSTSINDAVGMDAAAARRNSPVLLAPATHAPVTVAVGGAESAQYHRQAEDFVRAWRAHEIDVTLLDLPGRNHFTIVPELADPGGALLERACAMLGE